MNLDDDMPTPVEAWLTQTDVGVAFWLVSGGESSYELEIQSRSIPTAKQEITEFLTHLGYKPAGQWTTAYGDEGVAVFRHFKK
jgi:hypothetical protein